MRILGLILATLGLTLNAPASYFAITQHLLNYGAVSGTISQSVVCTAGRGYIIVLRGTAACPSPALSTTIDSPVLALNYHATSGSQSVIVYYVLSSAGGANTISATLTSGGTMADLSLSFIECTGLSSFDGIQAGTVGSSATTLSTNVTTGTDALFSFWLNEAGGMDNINYYNALGAGSVNVSGVKISANNGQSSGDYFWAGNGAGVPAGTYTNFLTANVSSVNTIVTAAFRITTGPGPTLYVSQYGVGLTNGADAADAWSEAILNDPAFWPGQGSTIHLIGTLTNQLTVNGSGTATYPVTFVFDPGANFTSGAWPVTGSSPYYGGAIYPNGSRYIVVDGKGTGIIQNTNNGTGLGTYLTSPNQVPVSGAIAGVCSNWVVKNLIMTNIYNRQSVTDYVAQGLGIYLVGSDFCISNNVLSDAQGLVYVGGGGAITGLQQNYFIVSNVLLNANHFLNLSFADGCVISNIWVYGNTYDHADRWDGRVNAPSVNGADGGPRFHQDYNYIADDNTHYYTNGWLDHVHIFNNVWGENVSADLSVVTGLGYTLNTVTGFYTNNLTPPGQTDVVQHGATSIDNLYLDSTADEVRNIYVYNNVWRWPGTLPGMSNPGGFAGSNIWVFNNTCVRPANNATGTGKPLEATGISVHVYNNIAFYGTGIQVGSQSGTEANPQISYAYLHTASDCATIGSDMNNTLNNLQTVVSDYNVFPNVSVQGFTATMGTTIAGPAAHTFAWDTLAQWQTFNGNSCSISPLWNTTGADPHSTANTITWSAGNLVPALTDTTAQGTGLNLYSAMVAQGETTALYDFNGAPRSSTGNWDAGAFVVNPGGGGGGGGSLGGFLRIHR